MKNQARKGRKYFRTYMFLILLELWNNFVREKRVFDEESRPEKPKLLSHLYVPYYVRTVEQFCKGARLQ